MDAVLGWNRVRVLSDAVIKQRAKVIVATDNINLLKNLVQNQLNHSTKQ